MLRWITEFIDQNSHSWKKRRENQLEERTRAEKSWEKMNMEKKRIQFEEEELAKRRKKGRTQRLSRKEDWRR